MDEYLLLSRLNSSSSATELGLAEESHESRESLELLPVESREAVVSEAAEEEEDEEEEGRRRRVRTMERRGERWRGRSWPL